MNNINLFTLINAPPSLGSGRLWLAIMLAQWLIFLLPVGMAFAWVLGDHLARRELLVMLLATALALFAAHVIALVWPQPRPITLNKGAQYINSWEAPGLPSEHVTVFWSLALAALSTQRFAVWSFPLLAAGLAVGWSRVFFGLHFPFDILGALPVAILGVFAERLLHLAAMPAITRLLCLYDQKASAARSWWISLCKD